MEGGWANGHIHLPPISPAPLQIGEWGVVVIPVFFPCHLGQQSRPPPLIISPVQPSACMIVPGSGTTPTILRSSIPPTKPKLLPTSFPIQKLLEANCVAIPAMPPISVPVSNSPFLYILIVSAAARVTRKYNLHIVPARVRHSVAQPPVGISIARVTTGRVIDSGNIRSPRAVARASRTYVECSVYSPNITPRFA